jgi:hypothetical protein
VLAAGGAALHVDAAFAVKQKNKTQETARHDGVR